MAPSHHLWSPLSMHPKGWLQTDKYYIYNMNIYSNFNGLLMEFLFSYSFNLLYWFILVMRNNIMFCGFISFFFYWIIIIIIIICCMVFMDTHSYKYTHSTNSSEQYVLFLLWGDWCMTLKCTFFCFLINNFDIHPHILVIWYSKSQLLSFGNANIEPLFGVRRMVQTS